MRPVLAATAPVADFTANTTSGNVPLSVQFNDASSGDGITGWQWNFGDHPFKLYVTDYSNNAAMVIYPNGSTVTLNNTFYAPQAVAVDSCGNVYVADTQNNMTKKIYPNGSVVTLYTGFNAPQGIAVDSSGNVYVADTNNHMVKEFYPNGTMRMLGNSSNEFFWPVGVAVDTSGNVYVGDCGHGMVKKIYTNNTTVTLASGFNYPKGVAVDMSGNVYVADDNNNAVKMVYPNGTNVSLGSGFNHPRGVAVDTSGNVYVTDTGHGMVKKIYTNNTTVTLASGFTNPWGIAVTPPDSVLRNPMHTYDNTGLYNVTLAVTNDGGTSAKQALNYIAVHNVTPVAGFSSNVTNGSAPLTVQFTDVSTGSNITSWQWSFGDGTANSSMQSPVHTYSTAGIYNVTLTVANDGGTSSKQLINYIAVLDAGLMANFSVDRQAGYAPLTVQFNDTSSGDDIIGRQWNFEDNVSIYLARGGNPVEVFYSNGTIGTLASGINDPSDVAVDFFGNVYVTDSDNNVVEKIYPNGTAVSLGSGFVKPYHIAVDFFGNVYVTELDNQSIKKLYPNGTMVLLGSGFVNPNGIAVDSSGNVYVADTYNDAVKEIYVNGSIVTLGNYSSGFYHPYGVAVDSSGNVYVADTGHSAVKKIYTNGTIVTLTTGFVSPSGVAVDLNGDVYVKNFSVIGKICTNGTIITLIDLIYRGFAVLPLPDSFEQNPVHTYSSPGNYTVSLTVFNQDGSNTTVAPGLITAYQFTASFTSNVTRGLAPFTVQFTDASISTSKPITGWQWDFGDGESSTLRNPVHTYSSAGNYTVTLTVANDEVSNTKELIDYIVARNSDLAADFTASRETGNVPFSVQFNDTSSGGYEATGWEWSFGDNPDNGSVYLADYSYYGPVIWEVYSNGTSRAMSTAPFHPWGIAVDRYGNLYASGSTFEYNGNGVMKIYPNGTTVMLAYGSINPYGVAVDLSGNVYLSDGYYSYIKVIYPNHTVVSLGYGFSNPNGVAVDSRGNVYVADTDNNAVKKIYAINGTVTTLNDREFNHPIGVAVDASDNVFVADTNNGSVKEIYANGTIVTLASGLDLPRYVTVDARGNVYVSTNWYDGVTKICTDGSIVRLSNPYALAQVPHGIAFSPPAGCINVDSAERNPIHTYSTPGNYTVSQTVFNQDGSSTKVATNLITASQLTASFSSNAMWGIIPFTVQFTDTSICTGKPITGWQWDFGDGTPNSTEQNPMHTYNIAGNYNVTLTVTNDDGSNTKQLINYSKVRNSELAADFTVDRQVSNAPLTVQFNDTSSGDDIIGRQWGFGDNPDNVNTYVVRSGNQVQVLYPNGNMGTLASGFSDPSGVAVDSFGNAYVADTGNNAIKKIYPDGSVVSLGGGFSSPRGVAVDSIGNVYVADTGNNAIKKIYPNGSVVLLGSGFADPLSVAVDSFGNVYATDYYYNLAVKKIYPNNTVVTLAGGLSDVHCVAVDAFGNVYYAESNIHDVKKIYPNGAIVSLGIGFNYPHSVAVDFLGNVYVRDNDKICKIYTNGTFRTLIDGVSSTKTWIHGIQTTCDGIAVLPLPDSVERNPAHTYSSPGNYTVSLTAYNPDGSDTLVAPGFLTAYNFTASFTSNTTEGNVPLTVQFNDTSIGYNITGWQWDFGDGTPNSTEQNPIHTYNTVGVYSVTLTVVNDYGSTTKQLIDHITVHNATLVACFTSNTTTGNAPLSVQFNDTSAGNNINEWQWNFEDNNNVTVYVTDYYNSLFRVIYPDGTYRDQSGGFSNPYDITADPYGNVYLTEYNRDWVKEIYRNGTIRTLTGGFLHPYGLAIDASGNVYVADMYNKAVKEIYPNGTVVTLASGLNLPVHVAVDPSGNVYVADLYTSQADMPNMGIKEIYTNGTVVTLASGFNSPRGVAVDLNGNVYVLDSSTNGMVYKIYPNGTMVTLATDLDLPESVSVDPAGNVYVTDRYHNAVKKIYTDGSIITFNSINKPFGVAILASPYILVQNPVYTFSKAGVYNVTLTATNDGGSSVSRQTNYITVHNATPVAGFTSNVTSGSLPLAVQFNDTSAGYNITEWLWDFGDGTPNSTEQNPIHAYADVGLYNVTLTVTNDGGSSTRQAAGYIFVSYTPVAGFNANVTSGMAPLAVQFNDTSTGNGIYSWQWNFGDGTANDTGQNPVHVFSIGGVYTVTLTATNNGGPSTKAMPGYISVLNATPVASFITNVMTVRPLVDLQFNDTSIGYNITEWQWDFGDGTPNSTERNPVHAYADVGLYSVTLTVMNDGGSSTRQAAGYILVSNEPVVSFTANVTGGLAPLTVQFNDTSIDSPTSWVWNFGERFNNGNVYVADYYDQTVKEIYTDGTVVTLASGFSSPRSVAIDANSNVYVTDTDIHAIKKIYPNGTIVTLGGGFSSPSGVAVDTISNVYVADTGNNAVKKIYPNGTIVTLASGFRSPSGVAVDSTGNVYVADTTNNAVKKICTDGSVVTLPSGSGFYRPNGVAVDSNGNVYVADGRSAIKKIYTNGSVVTLGDYSSGFYQSYGVAVDSNGNVYVADSGNNAVKKIYPNGTIVTLAGGFSSPRGVTIMPYDSIVQNPVHTYNAPGIYNVSLTASNQRETNTVAATGYTTVYQALVASFTANVTGGVAPFTVQFTSTSAGFPIPSLSWDFGDGSNNSTEQNPVHIFSSAGAYNVTLTATNDNGSSTRQAVDYINAYSSPMAAGFTSNVTCGIAPFTVQFNDTSSNGPTSWVWDFGEHPYSAKVYTADSNNNATMVIYPNGSIATLASGFRPSDVAADSSGNVYVSDSSNNAIKVIYPNGSIATLVSGLSGHFAVGSTGNVYVSNSSNNEIKVIYPNGTIVTLPCGFVPSGVAVDSTGNVYAADYGNSTVKKIYANGSVVTLSYEFYRPYGAAVDSAGNVYVADTYNDAVKVLYPNGTVVTLASGFRPFGIDVDSFGNVYVVDYYNSAVKVIYTNGTIVTLPCGFRPSGVAIMPHDSVVQNPVYTYSAPGVYNVTLTVSNQRETNTTVATGYITVPMYMAPVASFTANVTGGIAPLAVQFNDTSSNNPTSWAWDFGDGTENSTEQNPVHAFTDPGLYNVTLTAMNDGGSNTSQAVGYIAVHNAVPVSSFSSSAITGIAPLTVQFNDTSTGNNITGWQWSFGDGTENSTLNNPVHVYNSAGLYSVMLTVTNDGGSNTSRVEDYIIVHNTTPVASFAANATMGIVPMTVQFNDTSAGSNITVWQWDFGDGTGNRSDRSPVHIYSGAGVYTVTLSITNDGGGSTCQVAGYINVHNATPMASFVSNVTGGNLPLAVQFTDTSAGSNITAWQWSFGDGSANDTARNPVHVFDNAGVYTVTLTVTNDGGSGTSQATDYITVHNAIPVASFTSNATTGSAPLAVLFTDTSSGSNITEWQWDFGDGTGNATTRDAAHTFINSGEYPVTLTVSNDGGSGTYQLVIHVTALAVLDAGLATDVTGGVAPLTVQFTDASTGCPDSWQWNFGDGTPNETTRDASHTFTNAGTYTVMLTATNSTTGQSDTATCEISAVPPSLPVAGFTASPTSGNAPLTVQFTDTSSGDDITGWQWNFGDGTANDTARSPMHVFSSAGTYDITLTVTNATGSASITEPGYITVHNTAPVASFMGNVTSGCAPLTVQFIDTSSGDNIGGWQWNFGDGTENSTLRNPDHVFASVGNYTVVLTVANDGGLSTAVMPDYVTVEREAETNVTLTANFTSNVTSGCAPLTVQFLDTSTGNNLTGWQWDFGDGTGNSSGQNPIHTYSATGAYTVTLTVTNETSTASTKQAVDYIAVQLMALSAGFTANATSGYAPFTVQFTDASTGHPDSWQWSFGDGTPNATTRDASHTFTSAGTYEVVLTVANDTWGQSSTASAFIHVAIHSSPVAGFTVNRSLGVTPLTIQFTDASTGDDITSWYWNFGDGNTSALRDPAYTYTAGGVYTVSLTVTSLYGSDSLVRRDYIDAIPPGTTVKPPAPGVTFNAPLNKGWNLVSMPVAPEDGSTDGVFASIKDDVIVVWGYDSFDARQPWRYYVPGRGDNTLNWIDQTMGVWVLCKNATVLTFKGQPVYDTSVPMNDSNWNLVGYPYLVTHTPEELYGSCVAIWGYENEGWYLHTTIPGYSNSLTEMKPGNGYWVLPKI